MVGQCPKEAQYMLPGGCRSLAGPVLRIAICRLKILGGQVPAGAIFIYFSTVSFGYTDLD